MIYPIFAMVTLTFLVWVIAVRQRIKEMKTRKIPPQSIARARDVAEQLQNTQALDNFNNLFQMPVLFYVAAILLIVHPTHSTLAQSLGWLYVTLRYAHSFIQITHNTVMHRFYVWTASNIVLATLWIVIGVQIISA